MKPTLARVFGGAGKEGLNFTAVSGADHIVGRWVRSHCRRSDEGLFRSIVGSDERLTCGMFHRAGDPESKNTGYIKDRKADQSLDLATSATSSR